MADKNRYPQIPATVWWGVRNFLNRTPNATLDERALSVHLNVQPVAAKQYVSELKWVGIINDEGKATPLAHKWRLDKTYGEAVNEIMAKAYPDSLRHVAPDGVDDRSKIMAWFQGEGLGSGAARNKVAAYLLLGSPSPGESPTKTSNAASQSASKTSPRKSAGAKPPSIVEKAGSGGRNPSGGIPLNVNVQIHIGADAGSEQIEAIFSAMRRYLNDTKSD